MPPKSPISKRERLVTKLGKLKKKVDSATKALDKHKASEPKSADMIAFHNAITKAHKAELKKQTDLYRATQFAIDLTDADEARYAQNLKLYGPPPPKEISSLLNEWP